MRFPHHIKQQWTCWLRGMTVLGFFHPRFRISLTNTNQKLLSEPPLLPLDRRCSQQNRANYYFNFNTSYRAYSLSLKNEGKTILQCRCMNTKASNKFYAFRKLLTKFYNVKAQQGNISRSTFLCHARVFPFVKVVPLPGTQSDVRIICLLVVSRNSPFAHIPYKKPLLMLEKKSYN